MKSSFGSSNTTSYSSDPASRVGILRTRLRAALELHHMALFFRANAHFQIKTNEEMTKPGSLDFDKFEKLEKEGYEAAKEVRREILCEVRFLFYHHIFDMFEHELHSSSLT